jgi:hypothetical protein
LQILYGVYNCCRYFGTVAGMGTNVTIDFLVTINTSFTKVTNVPTVIFASMVAKVSTGRWCYIYTSAVQIFLSCLIRAGYRAFLRFGIEPHSAYDDI